jgi:hypothetical protein
MRLSKAVPTRFGLVPAEDPKSGVETADLEPWSETPLKLAVLPVGARRLFVPEPADHPGGDVGVDEEGVLRGAGIFDVKPGGGVAAPGKGVAVPDGGVVVPAGGVVVPDGCHAGGGDDGDEG